MDQNFGCVARADNPEDLEFRGRLEPEADVDSEDAQIFLFTCL